MIRFSNSKPNKRMLISKLSLASFLRVSVKSRIVSTKSL